MTTLIVRFSDGAVCHSTPFATDAEATEFADEILNNVDSRCRFDRLESVESDEDESADVAVEDCLYVKQSLTKTEVGELLYA